MGAITIEFAGRTEDPEPCPCCGGRTTRLTRFVYFDGDAHAAYYAQFSNNHPQKWVSALIGLGEWGDASTPAKRVAFAVRIRLADDLQVMLVDSVDCPWHGEDFLGKILDRRDALKHWWKKEVFHITDHIVADDPDVREYFDQA